MWGGDTLKPGFNRIKKSLILMRRYKIELHVTGKLQKERKKKKKKKRWVARKGSGAQRKMK